MVIGTHPPTGTAVIGCGSVSRHYLRTLRLFGVLEVLWCADMRPERSSRRVAEFSLGAASTVAQALADPAVELVVNLTPPSEHAAITRQALRSGKSVYVEKPLATTAAEARELLELADETGALLACAPDTMLGRGVQTARHVIDSGVIGLPTAALAAMAVPGHELWHPDPQYYYQSGAGPLYDMGPYYLSLLVTLLGPVTSVSAHERVSVRERRVATGPRTGTPIRVDTPTMVMAVLEFASNAVASLACTFDAWATMTPRLEIHGTRGSMQAADPNTFGGPLLTSVGVDGQWSEVTLVPGYDVERGIGVADLAAALHSGSVPRASAELAVHILDVMEAIGASASRRCAVPVPSSVRLPAPVVPDLSEYGWSGIDDVVDLRLASIV